jgi:hypothetical protein
MKDGNRKQFDSSLKRINFRFIHQISDPTYYVCQIMQVTAAEHLDKMS